MLKKNHELLAAYKIFLPVFDVADDGDAGDGDGGAGGGEGGSKSFTQEQVNSMIAQERKKLDEQYKVQDAERLQELKAVQAKSNLNKNEREDMAKKITELEKKVYSAEELAERERNKLLTEATQEKEQLSAERDAWRTRHNEAQIGRDISDAAVLADAINPKQIEAILRPLTSVAEDKGPDGEVRFETKINMNVTDAEGKPVTIVMDPKKAVETLKENNEYFNLFKGTSTSGLGQGNAGGKTGKADYSNMSMEEYRRTTRGQKK